MPAIELLEEFSTKSWHEMEENEIQAITGATQHDSHFQSELLCEISDGLCWLFANCFTRATGKTVLAFLKEYKDKKTTN